MLKWVQSGLSAVAGTAEPEYGKEAIHPITEAIGGEVPVYRETTEKDFHWQKPGFTNVETQVFYFTDLTSGNVGFAQIIHSNVMGVHTTAQFTFRLYRRDGATITDSIWTSTKLENFRTEGANFYADDLSIELVNDEYILKSAVTEESVVDLVVKRLSPGVIFGKDGATYYGDDISEPWGSMRHLFWPRCGVVGTIKSPTKTYEIKGYTMFVMALQGMKPHHAAKSWNFLNFQSEHYSAVQMEFTTPKSYDNTKVNVGMISSNDKILHATVDNDVVHKDQEVDEVGWNVPKSIEFNFVDKDESNEEHVIATVNGDLDVLIERVDVMAEIPQFVKNIVSGVAGTKPYIYQYSNKFSIELKDEGVTEEGIAFNEVTFISE